MNRTPLSAIASHRGLVGGPFGSSLVSSDYTVDGVPVIRGTNLGHGRYVNGDYAYVSREKVERDLARNTAIAGDVVFTQRGTLGQVALVPDGHFPEYVVSQSQMRLRVDPAIARADFIYYACTTGTFLRQIADRAISTGVPHTNLGILSQLEVPFPSLAEQQAIAEVLGALDDKIAANTALALTADLVMRAEYQGLAGDRRVRVSEVSESPRNGVDPTAVDRASAYVGLEHIPRRSMWLADAGTAADVTSGKSRFKAEDVLFGKLRPYFHKVVSANSSGICSTDVLVVRAKDADMASVLLVALSSDEVVKAVVSASEGTRMPRTSWKDLAAVEINWPSAEHASSVADRLNAMRAGVLSVLEENRTLAGTRDALLPQLMSGKLRVRDAERIISQDSA